MDIRDLRDDAATASHRLYYYHGLDNGRIARTHALNATTFDAAVEEARRLLERTYDIDAIVVLDAADMTNSVRIDID